MQIKYNSKFLSQIENIFKEAGYTLRYEKGNFQSGYCILKTQKIIIVNQYYPLEGKINCLIHILKNVDWKFENLNETSEKLYQSIVQSPNVQLNLDYGV